MLEMILQNFQENNNIINVAANKEFMRFKNHIHHVLSIQKIFLITHKSYIDDFKIISIAFMNYQKSSSYVQHIMNMIFRFHKFFVYCYINDIVIFLKILKNHFKHLNTVFNLFNELRIIFKKVKTHLNYSSIILLD